MLNEKFILEQIEKYCNLDNNLSMGTFNEQVVAPLENSPEMCQYDWYSDAGVSKGVLVFDDLDFVIKIPFYAEYFEEEEVDYDEENDEPIYEGGYTSEYPFEGVEVEGFVKENAWDYCETEMLRYEVAKRNFMEEHFAQTYFIGYAKGWPIYGQVRACMFRSEESRSTRSRKNYSDEERATAKKIREDNNFFLDDEWVMDFVAYWGKDRMLAFIEFCDKWFISDLHSGNLGYVCGIPCLIDYSSFEC